MKGIADSLKMKKVDRSPEDEVFLTELAFDLKNTITYELSSVILVAEREQSNPFGKFRCYMDNNSKDFFVEISNEGTLNAFGGSALMNVMGLAENNGAENIYICVRKTVENQEAYLRNYMFLGFEELNEAEQAKISMTKSHNLLKCPLKNNYDDE